MSKYSLVKLMENEDDFQSSRFTRKNNLILEPITLSVKKLIDIIKDSKFQKGVFVQDVGSVAQAKENYFGTGITPTVKKSMEELFSTLSKEEWIDKFTKYKYGSLEKKYETLSKNNSKFHIITRDAIDALEKELDKKSKTSLPEPQIKEKSIVYIPNDANTISNIRKDLTKILTNAKKKEGVDYKFIEKESI